MYSKEHKLFLKKIKKNNYIVITFQVLILFSFIIIWEYLARKEVINTFIFSSPTKVIKTIGVLYKTGLFKHISITLYEVLISFTIGTLLGLICATILWWNKLIARIVDPYLTVINSLPKVALGPIIIIWIGANTKSIITMALLISTIVSIMNIYQYFINTDINKINLLKSFNATKIQIYLNLILPSNIINLLSTLKINISMTLIGVIMGEFLSSKAGIGYLIIYGSQIFNLNIVITGVIILSLVAYLLYYLIYYIEKKVNK